MYKTLIYLHFSVYIYTDNRKGNVINKNSKYISYETLKMVYYSYFHSIMAYRLVF